MSRIPKKIIVNAGFVCIGSLEKDIGFDKIMDHAICQGTEEFFTSS